MLAYKLVWSFYISCLDYHMVFMKCNMEKEMKRFQEPKDQDNLSVSVF